MRRQHIGEVSGRHHKTILAIFGELDFNVIKVSVR